MDFIYAAAGLGLLLFGGEMLVRGSVALARKLGVSPLIIGLTIVGYGTSAPELLVSLEAHLSGHSPIAVGNVVGSNIANILLIIGCAGLVYPLQCRPRAVRGGGAVMLGAALVMVLLGLSGEITAWQGGLMLAAIISFSWLSYRWERKANGGTEAASLHIEEAQELEEGGPQTLTMSIVCVLLGIAGVVAGSHFLIEGAVGLARDFGVSEATIGLTLVAIGTSLPELATALVSAYRRHPEVALGNVIGANAFNILCIMGIVPLFGTIAIPARIAAFDMWIMFGVTAVFALWIQWCGRVGRPAAFVLLACYAAYLGAHFYGLSGIAS